MREAEAGNPEADQSEPPDQDEREPCYHPSTRPYIQTRRVSCCLLSGGRVRVQLGPPGKRGQMERRRPSELITQD